MLWIVLNVSYLNLLHTLNSYCISIWHIVFPSGAYQIYVWYFWSNYIWLQFGTDSSLCNLRPRVLNLEPIFLDPAGWKIVDDIAGKLREGYHVLNTPTHEMDEILLENLADNNVTQVGTNLGLLRGQIPFDNALTSKITVSHSLKVILIQQICLPLWRLL